MPRVLMALPLLLALSAAQEGAEKAPEPGPIPTGVLRPGKLEIPARKGGVGDALRTFVEAHRAHEEGDLDRALRGYLAFLGTRSRAALPARYERTVEERVEKLRARVRKRYEEALALYEEDRHKGLAEIHAISERYPMLPEGGAALALEHSDELRAAMTDARALAKRGEREQAARLLERAVRSLTAALYRYEAKSLLVELGGPDLFTADERVGDRDEDRKEAERGRKRGEKEPETVIEVGD